MKNKTTLISHIPEGVLNSRWVRRLHEEGAITRASGEPLKVKRSSIDLHVSELGWMLKGSVKQKEREKRKKGNVDNICNELMIEKLKLDSKGLKLKKGNVYVFKLDEYINLSRFPWLCGVATGKSSVGRIDVLTRLIADSSPSYDKIKFGYRGHLYVEIIPISFNIIIRLNDRLNQLRIYCGEPKPLDPLIGYRLLFKGGKGRFAYKAQNEGTLSVNLEPTIWGTQKIVALQAKKDVKPPINLKLRDIDPYKYFDPVPGDGSNLHIIKNEFYILRSVERLALPEDIAVTGFAYTEHLGEVRIHYAGFAHPYFGFGREDKKIGTPLIFEVRAHNFDVVLRNDETFAKILFYKMSESIPESEQKPDVYSNQELKLSNYFREP